MKKQSFNKFIEKHPARMAKTLKSNLPNIETWGELPRHIRNAGMSDDQVVDVRALWREYKG